jgi:RNA polymerase-binding protein
MRRRYKSYGIESRGYHYRNPMLNELLEEPCEKKEVEYNCPIGHVSLISFEFSADVPDEYRCTYCGRPADVDPLRANLLAKALVSPRTELTYKRPIDFVRERRTEEELEALLAERIQYVRDNKLV